jgi:two-component system response regulator FixJ
MVGMDALRQQPPRRGRIVIVEDDAGVRRSLQLLLTGQGHEVRAYSSARGLASDPEALKSDCLVADLVMPDSDGLALLRQLRHAGWEGRAVLISGHLDESWKRRAQGEGFDAIFEKPLAESTLTDCIGKLIGSPVDR